MKKVILIGAGKMGMNHLRNLINILEKKQIFVFDPNEAACKRCEETGVSIVRDKSEILEGDFTHAIIATPTSTHLEWINDLYGKVKKILVEKPIVIDIDQSVELIELMDLGQSEITGGFIERFNPAVCELRNQLALSDHIFSANFTRTNKVSSRITDVDVVVDLMVHDIDLALQFFGKVEEVSALGTMSDDQIDHATAMLRHENGCITTLTASRLVHKKIRLIEVNTIGSRIECDLLKKDLLVLRDHQEEEVPGKPYKLVSSNEVVEVKSTEALYSELQLFINEKSFSIYKTEPHSSADMKILIDVVEKIRGQIHE